jgi:hypothetical protein
MKPKLAFLHQSKINRSECRLFITTGYKKTSSLIKAEIFWVNDESSYDEALAKLKWHCERFSYELNNGE